MQTSAKTRKPFGRSRKTKYYLGLSIQLGFAAFGFGHLRSIGHCITWDFRCNGMRSIYQRCLFARCHNPCVSNENSWREGRRIVNLGVEVEVFERCHQLLQLTDCRVKSIIAKVMVILLTFPRFAFILSMQVYIWKVLYPLNMYKLILSMQ